MKFSDINLSICSHYAGIGSRETPQDIMDLMSRIAAKLESMNLILRSGGANGADTAFSNGVKEECNKQIFLPWVGFNNATGVFLGSKMADAEKIAKQAHPRWNKCSRDAKALLTRNTFQVLGPNLDNCSDFVICWTSDGKASGGTGQALRIAKAYNIPIFNLKKEEHRAQLERFVEQTNLPI